MAGLFTELEAGKAMATARAATSEAPVRGGLVGTAGTLVNGHSSGKVALATASGYKVRGVGIEHVGRAM